MTFSLVPTCFFVFVCGLQTYLFFGYYSSFLFWVTATSFVALSGFGLNFLFHSGLTKLHHVHQKRNRKDKK